MSLAGSRRRHNSGTGEVGFGSLHENCFKPEESSALFEFVCYIGEGSEHSRVRGAAAFPRMTAVSPGRIRQGWAFSALPPGAVFGAADSELDLNSLGIRVPGFCRRARVITAAGKRQSAAANMKGAVPSAIYGTGCRNHNVGCLMWHWDTSGSGCWRS